MTANSLYFKRSGFIDSQWNLVKGDKVLGKLKLSFWGNRAEINFDGQNYLFKRNWWSWFTGGSSNLIYKNNLQIGNYKGNKATINGIVYEFRTNFLGFNKGWFVGDKKIIEIKPNDFFLDQEDENCVLLVFLIKFFSLPASAS
jgi:hypothetical protein